MKFWVCFDVDATLVDTESRQGSFYRSALREVFKDNQKALDNIDTYLPDDDRGRIWYYENVMGNVAGQQEVFSKYIAPITEEQVKQVQANVSSMIVDALPDTKVVEGMGILLRKCYNDPDINVVFISSGSSEAVIKSLLTTGLINSYSSHRGVFTRDCFADGKDYVLQRIIDTENISPEQIIMIGDGKKDMKSVQDINKTLPLYEPKAYAIGYVGAFKGATDEFLKNHTRFLLRNGANCVVDNVGSLYYQINSRILGVKKEDNNLSDEKKLERKINIKYPLPLGLQKEDSCLPSKQGEITQINLLQLQSLVRQRS